MLFERTEANYCKSICNEMIVIRSKILYKKQ